MGMLVCGEWRTDDVRHTADGKFIHLDSRIRNWVTPDGAPGPAGEGGFKAEPDRYHLYMSTACPFAHRAVILRSIKGLQNLISMSGVDSQKGQNGWTFEQAPGIEADPILNAQYLHQVYTQSDAAFTGRVTVPVLWDRTREVIVSNDSQDLMRMFNSAFDHLGAVAGDYFPGTLRTKIERLSEELQAFVNIGVYKAGFSKNQSAYDEAESALFDYLEKLEQRLSGQRFLCGDRITGVDWQLFTTLVRFDAVYYVHFKCNRRRLVDFPNLWDYVRELYQQPGVSLTVDLAHIKQHYYGSHRHLNPSGLVPAGPDIDFFVPHHREKLSSVL